jgi:hypothetical protein
MALRIAFEHTRPVRQRSKHAQAIALYDLSQIFVAKHTRCKPFHSVAPLTRCALERLLAQRLKKS